MKGMLVKILAILLAAMMTIGCLSVMAEEPAVEPAVEAGESEGESGESEGESGESEGESEVVEALNYESAGDRADAFEYYEGAPLLKVVLDEADPDYIKCLWQAGVYNYKLLRSLPTLFENDAWSTAQSSTNLMAAMDPENFSEADIAKIMKTKEDTDAVMEAQLKPYEDGINGEVIYIWEEGNMPTTIENVEESFTVDSWDNPNFRPYLVPYLLEDPASAKGTVIVLSGGGNQTRSDPNEGFKVAPAFNEVGYNCFLLERRVDPYNNEDIVMDLQRAIRFVKYHAAEWGIDLENTLLAEAGFSGGAGNVCTQIETFYGDVQPSDYDPNYVPDEIDAMNADVDVAMPIYNGRPLRTENPNLPHIFLAVGVDDRYSTGYDMLKWIKEEPAYSNVAVEMHIFAQNGHGFGAGNKGTTSMTWIPTADVFMQKAMGYSEVSYEGEIPEEYTLTQKIHVDWFPIGPTDVDVYTTGDQGKVLYTFFGWGDNIMVEGLLIGGHVADVTMDTVGYFKEDAYKMWDLVDPSAWVPVER